MRRIWLFIWLVVGVYFVIAAAGGGSATSAIRSMLAGFMAARNISDMVMRPNSVHSESEQS